MVMRKNAMHKNLRQSIFRSFGRYVALALIIGLGASLFLGLIITRQDMVRTGQHFMDQQNMFDLRMVSNYGWSEPYVEAFANLPGVEEAEGLIYLDLISRTENMEEDTVYRFYALPHRMNRVALRSGRMPENAQECLIGGFLTDDSILGKQIFVSSHNEKDTLDSIKDTSFTIVGRIASPLYMDINRGTTSVGSGSVEDFLYLPAQAFDMDYYAEIHLTLEKDFDIFTNAYNDYLEDTLDALEPAAEELSLQRFLDVKAEAEEEYQEGYQEYLEGLEEFEDAKAEGEQELADAYQELKDAEEELEDGRKELIDAEKEIESGKKAIAAGAVQYEKALAECESNLNLVRAGIPEAEAGVAAVESQAGMSGEQIKAAYNAASNGVTTAASAISSLEAAIAAAEAAPEEERDPELIASLKNQLSVAKAGYDVASQNLSNITPLYEGYTYAYGILADLKSNETQLVNGIAKIKKGLADLQDKERELHYAENKLWIGWGEWAEGRDELEEGWVDYEEAQVEFHKEITKAEATLKDAEKELQKAREEIDDMEEPDLIMLDRNSNVGYNNLDSSSSVVSGVSRVLPVFFLLVASLVCITTMTRMIDEERIQIGTLKALGYTNREIIRKYLFYSGSSAVIGCSLGILMGCTVIPSVIWESYKTMLYIQPKLLLSMNWPVSIAIVLVYTGLMLSVTWYSCRKTLEEEPAQLIRPKAPDPGKKILLERLWLWQKLSFLNKVTLRNIFRYRQRLAMMLVGIGGCTALLLTGYGLRDSIVHIVDYQYQEITFYDLSVYFRKAPSEKQQEKFLEVIADTGDFLFYHQTSVDLDFEGKAKELYMISAEQQLTRFLDLHAGTRNVNLPEEDEVVLSIGVCNNMGIGLGDKITIRNADLQEMELTVSGIYDNYVSNYAIVHPDTIEKHWGSAPELQMAFLRVLPGQDVHELSAKISDLDFVLNVSISQDEAEMVETMMEALDKVIILIVVCAGLLEVCVLYNLTNININERIREIATIKVLGFNASETGAYVFKENLLLTVAGSLFGLLLGWGLLSFVIQQIKIDAVWFRVITMPMSYLLSVGLTLISAIVVDFIFYFKLEKINMAEALKSVE